MPSPYEILEWDFKVFKYYCILICATESPNIWTVVYVILCVFIPVYIKGIFSCFLCSFYSLPFWIFVGSRFFHCVLWIQPRMALCFIAVKFSLNNHQTFIALFMLRAKSPCLTRFIVPQALLFNPALCPEKKKKRKGLIYSPSYFIVHKAHNLHWHKFILSLMPSAYKCSSSNISDNDVQPAKLLWQRQQQQVAALIGNLFWAYCKQCG